MRRRNWQHFVLGFTSLSILTFAYAGAPDPEKARKQLEKKDIDFTVDEFIDAAESGEKNLVDLFLQAGMPVDSSDSWQHTAMNGAIERGQLAVVQQLLAAGASVTTPVDDDGCTPLHAAAEGMGANSVAITKLLISSGADLEAKCDHGATPLSKAMSRDYANQAAALLEAGAKVDTPNDNGETPLWEAAAFGRKTVLPVLIQGGANLEAADNQGVTPLIAASRTGEAASLEALLAAGANPNAKTTTGRTALIEVTAISEHNEQRMDNPQTDLLRMVQALIAAKADVNFQSTRQFGAGTALMQAAESGRTGVVRALLDAGANIDAKNSGDGTALMEAAKAGRADIVRLLLDRGANVAGADVTRKTALDWAADYPEIQAMLRDKGATSNSTPTNVARPAERSESPAKQPPVSEEQRAQALAELHKRGYPITDGSQFLNAAAQNDLEAVRLFLRSGMSVDTKDERDHATTALVNATFMDQPEMALLLLEHGADVNANNGSTPLMNAAGKCGMTEVVRILIERGADLDARAPGGATPLGMAKLFNCEANEKLLRDAGAKADLAPQKKPAAGDSGKSSSDKVEMPDTWSNLKVGAWVQYRFDSGSGVVSLMKWSVKQITPEKVVYVVESTTIIGETKMEGPPTEMAYDRTADYGASASDVTITKAKDTIDLKGKPMPVEVYTMEGTDANGDRYKTRMWMTDTVPFGTVKTEVNGALSQEAIDWGWEP